MAVGGMAVHSCKPTPVNPTPVKPTIAPPTANAAAEIVILHWNDLHGSLSAASKGDKDLGGVSRLVQLVNKARAMLRMIA